MPKIHYITKEGTKVTIEGTPQEVAAIAAHLKGDISTHPPKTKKKDRETKEKTKPTPINLISELIDGGFFRKPKELGIIKLTLEEQGHFFPVTTLSPSLLRLVRKKQLRRLKDKRRWLYVN